MQLLILQILVLVACRVVAKRKFRVRGNIKWISLVDILLIQETDNPIYWVSWVLWCFWWDIYDREYYKVAGLIGYIITCLRILWLLTSKQLIYVPSICTSIIMTYNALYINFF
jgi:hypothetical protein